MAKVNVGLPQGTRDFGPDIVRKRRFILKTIQDVFELYGFEPLETPALENLDTLMGKYGEEGDKLIFKILNNGLDNPAKKEQILSDFGKVVEGKNVSGITERALKYDLTIPFARYVAMNHTKLTLPFKRYQIQPVWRADRPQKGRYREFFQCDADVVGSYSLMNEVELASIYHDAFTALGLPNYDLRINSRKILAAIAELSGGAEKLTEITIAIDKLDKIGLDKVKEELTQRGLKTTQIGVIEKYLLITGSNEEKLSALKEIIGNNATGKQGINEIEFVIAATEKLNISVDLTLARGLNYYTGIIFEAKAPAEVKIGSIGGGGRYDDLTGQFGVPNIAGVGISFGVDRIYDVLEELNLFPEDVHTGTQVLFFNMGENESATAYNLMQQLRRKKVRAELYHEPAKLDKQFKYAEKKNIPFVAIMGSTEIEERTCMLKDLRSGKQEALSFEKLLEMNFK